MAARRVQGTHPMKRLLRLACLALLPLSLCVWAQASLVIQRCALAGFTHHAAPRLWHELREGDELQLALEQGNPHDPQAVRVSWQGQALGYLPRTLNGAIARALAEGIALEARIHRRQEHPDPRRRIEVEIRMRVSE